MRTNNDFANKAVTLGWVAVSLSLLAFVIALVALVQSFVSPKHVSSDDQYKRIVAEVWDLVEPVYSDFEIQKPPETPDTLTDALSPLFDLAKSTTTEAESSQEGGG